MTNREKFKEVFGFDPGDDDICPVHCPEDTPCNECVYNGWIFREYKPPHPDQDKSETIRQLKAEIDRIRDANEHLHDERYNDSLEILRLRKIITVMAIKLFGGDT